MKSLSETLRVLLLLLAVAVVFGIGEAPSAAATLPPAATTASLTPASAPVGQGAALLVAAYGFLLQLRRRGLRLR